MSESKGGWLYEGFCQEKVYHCIAGASDGEGIRIILSPLLGA